MKVNTFEALHELFLHSVWSVNAEDAAKAFTSVWLPFEKEDRGACIHTERF